MIMEMISKTKLKEVNKLRLHKEQVKQKCFLVFDEASINKARRLHLLKAAYQLNDGVVGIVKYLNSQPLGKRIIYLDEITDPSNLGKIIYLMKECGYFDLVLSPHSVSIYNEKCLAVAKDIIFDINVCYGDIKLLRELKKDHQIIATGLKGATLFNKLKVSPQFVMVFGNEARGVNEAILSLADVVTKIPIKNIDSLNVSVAASIVLHNLK